MNKQELKNVINDVVRDEKRNGELGESSLVLEKLTEIGDIIAVDRKYLRSCIQEVFENSNPINGFLGMFGFKIIKENDTKKIMRDPLTGEKLENIFKVDEKKLKVMVSDMSKELIASEKKNTEKMTGYINKINSLIEELDNEQIKSAKNDQEYKIYIDTVVKHLQFILSQIGPEQMNTPVAMEIQELFTDLGMKIFWNQEGSELSESSMFQILKINAPQNHKIKPCIMQNDEVISQGVIFITDTEEKSEEEKEWEKKHL